MLTINQLMKYLRNTHNINIKPNQKRQLQNIGYYHGFKGYRFIREDKNRINFESFDEIVALNQFDMNLKSLFYPYVMCIETTLKNYAIEALLKHSKSDDFDDIYNISLTDYKNNSYRSYKDKYTTRMRLKGIINNVLIRDYNTKKTVSHYFDSDRTIPIWSIFESLSFGEFGKLFECSSREVKLSVSSTLRFPSNIDGDGNITKFFIYALKDIRNAIAHNNIIFDTRFKTNKINKRLSLLIEQEIGIKNLNFDYIDAYVILIVYLLRKTGETKNNCKKIVSDYTKSTELLRISINNDICNKILGTTHRPNVKKLYDFIKNS